MSVNVKKVIRRIPGVVMAFLALYVVYSQMNDGLPEALSSIERIGFIVAVLAGYYIFYLLFSFLMTNPTFNPVVYKIDEDMISFNRIGTSKIVKRFTAGGYYNWIYRGDIEEFKFEQGFGNRHYKTTTLKLKMSQNSKVRSMKVFSLKEEDRLIIEDFLMNKAEKKL